MIDFHPIPRYNLPAKSQQWGGYGVAVTQRLVEPLSRVQLPLATPLGIYMPKKLLILSVSVGAGHVRAAQAILEQAKKTYPELDVTHVDVMMYLPSPIRKTVTKSYRIMMRRLPLVWHWLYNATNKPSSKKPLEPFTKLVERVNCAELYSFINKLKPDYILATHPFPADVIRQGQNDLIPKIPFSILLTDYGLHEFWIVPGASHYFVATEKMKGMLERRGITNAIVSGIPLDPVFYEEKNKLELRKTYGIPEKQKTFVAISGGQGLTALERIIKELFSAKEPTSIVAIAGDNKILENRLKKLEPPKHIKLIILGWTNKIDDYLRLADIVISKPGGVTTTECVALGVPMLAVQPLPGQEEENIEYLLENRYGVVARNPEDLLFYISEKPGALAPGLQNKAPAKASAEIILQTLLAG